MPEGPKRTKMTGKMKIGDSDLTNKNVRHLVKFEL
jgi:hypothetical protein